MTPVWQAPLSAHACGVFGWGGFRISSNLCLHRLPIVHGPAETQFTWSFGQVPELPEFSLTGRLIASDGTCLELAVGGDEKRLAYRVGRLGDFLIQAAKGLVEFFPSNRLADPMMTEHALVNSILPIYAGLRSVICLHGSAVSSSGYALVFAGPTGVGKSTTAWRLVQQGWNFLSDDAAVLRSDGEGWTVYPTARTIRIKELSCDGTWDIRGKKEAFAPAYSLPARLQEIMLLSKEGDGLIDIAPRSALLRSLIAVQPAWAWAGESTRAWLHRQTCDLLKLTSVKGQEDARCLPSTE